MPSRHELNVRAYAMGFDPSTLPNDSKLEQKVLWLEKHQTLTAITATAPTTTLTSSGTAGNNETMTINGRVYTFKTALTGAADEILIGAAATNTLDNIKDAINATSVSGSPGTTYGTGTKINTDVTAGTKTATTLVLTASDTNTFGTATTTETMANFAFTGGTLSAGTLGAAVLSNTNTATRDILGGLAGDKNVSQ